MEREWRETLDKGGTIKSIKIKILYPQDSTRASVFKVTYQKGISNKMYVENVSE